MFNFFNNIAKTARLWLCVAFTALFITTASALPGVTSTVTDQSGQFVYYKDSTFSRESYIGFIYYDEGTYGVRYYAPAVKDTYPLLPSKDVTILFSMDITKKYVELTGERILNAVGPEDLDIVNYIHDMIYELTAHRQKAGIVENEVSIPQEFEQFGGDVSITYNPMIPLFNMYKITDTKGKVQFQLVTAGRLTSDKDTNFADFDGLPVKVEDTHTFTPAKKSKKQTIEYTKFESHSQKITLDTQWTTNADNLFLLNDIAIVAFDVYKLDQSSKSGWDQSLLQLQRSFILGSLGAYPYSELSAHESKKNTEKYSTLLYNADSKSFTRDFKILTKLEDGSFAIMTMTVFQGAYSRNSKYFDSILKSYSVK